MATRKPPAPGYERHPLDPNLVRKIVPKTAAQAMYGHLPSAEERRQKEAIVERARKKGQGA